MSDVGRAEHFVRDTLVCTRCGTHTTNVHATRCAECDSTELESAAFILARAEGRVTVELVEAMRSLWSLGSAAGRGCMVLADLARKQGDQSGAVVMETRAETCERFAAWALAQSHEVSR